MLRTRLARADLPRPGSADGGGIRHLSDQPTWCQARTRLYRDGRLELEGFPAADISDYLVDESDTIWLDLRDPDSDDPPC